MTGMQRRCSTAGGHLSKMPTDMTRQVARLPRIGMGCMRLSTTADRDEARGVAVLHAALDAGVTLLDTADAYARDAEHRAQRTPDRARAARRGAAIGRTSSWRPRAADAAARRLDSGRPRAASRRGCEASRRGARCRAHRSLSAARARSAHPVVDERARARGVEARRLIAAIGLCNVTVGQIEEARRSPRSRRCRWSSARGRTRRSSAAWPHTADARHPAARLSPGRRTQRRRAAARQGDAARRAAARGVAVRNCDRLAPRSVVRHRSDPGPSRVETVHVDRARVRHHPDRRGPPQLDERFPLASDRGGDPQRPARASPDAQRR